MQISSLLPETEGTAFGNIEVESLTARSENITKGSLFFLLPGVGYGSEKFLPFCLSKRPAAIVSEYETNISFSIPIWKTDKIRQKYAFAMAKYEKIDFSRLRIHGVTGTNGKTSTAKILRFLLSRGECPVGFIGSGEISYGNERLTDTNYSMTTPDPDLLYPALAKMQRDGAGDAVMEVSSHAAALGKVAPIRFDTLIFLGLSPEHLDFHKTMEDYYEAKKSLFYQTERAVVLTDTEYGRRLYEELRGVFSPDNLVSVGAWEPAVFRIECPTDGGDRSVNGQSFNYRYGDVFSKIEMKHPARFQRYNAAAALAAASLAGLSAGELRRRIASFDFSAEVPGRWETVERSPEIVIDYAHTPLALESLLSELKSRKRPGEKLYLVFGCGGDRDTAKRPEMAKIAEKYADFSFVTEDNSRTESPLRIFKDIQKGFSDRDKYAVISDRRRAIVTAIGKAEECDTVALVGKGAERYAVGAEGIRVFDERKIVEEAMKERRAGHNKEYENENE